MPFIDAKITLPADDATKEKLKAEFGKTMSLLGKSETYLMVGIEDNYDLWMGGKKLDKGAYVALSLLGNASSEDYAKVTAAICNILSSELSIPSDGVYVTYHPIKDWGWNGTNF
jgi:phenylpyruvate tautomerase PptA (4-oxalocrotonate tautomerase family)